MSTPRPLPTPEEVAKKVKALRSEHGALPFAQTEAADMLEALANQLAIADNTIVQFRDKIIALEAGLRESQAKLCDAEALAERVRWQPIASAPKDGTEVIGRNGDSLLICSWEPLDNPVAKHWGIEGTWHRNNGGSGKDLMGAFSPTHWMPLPPAPDAP